MSIKKNYFAPLASGLGATRRAAVLLLVMMLTATTAWAQTTITPTTPSQDGDGYYSIGNAAELYGFAGIVNNGNAAANAKLTADIVVNENVLDANGDANTGDFAQWTPIGNFGNSMPYSGTFDGQGHTISGLYASGKGWGVGFIGKVSGSAVVKNLGIVDSYFSSANNHLGSIVGYVDYGSSVTLANVYSTSTVKGDNWIGGLVGGDGEGSVSVVNAYFAGKTSAIIQSGAYGSHHDDLVAGDSYTPNVCNAFVLGTSRYGTSVTAAQLSDGTVAAALHYYQDALADGSMFGISDGKTTFSGSLEGVSVTTADITLHTFDGDTRVYSSKYVVGNTTPLPVNVVREGYIFFGWYDNANLEGNAVTSISSSATGNKEYWAKFERSHSVTFVLDGGSIQTGEIDHYLEGKTTALPTYVTKNGASFEGWFTEEDFSGSRYYFIPSTATEDMTFYAKWGDAKTTFYLFQGGNAENVLYEGENVVYLDETDEDGYYVYDENGYCWGRDDRISVPYTGEESTFMYDATEFVVAQSGFYVFTLTDKDEGNWFVSVLYPLEMYCTVADIPDQTYTGSAIEPEVTITDGETALTLGTDYTVEYSDNTNAGTAKVTISGAGNYGGSIEKTFTITPKVVTVTADSKTKEYGEADPALTYSSDGLVGSDALTGALSRAEGEAVGEYAINLGTLTAGSNYSLTLADNDAKLTITSNPTISLTAKQVDGDYWTTFYCGDAAYTIDDEKAWAYTATYSVESEQGVLTLHKLGKDIPQATAVIVVGDGASIGLTKNDGIAAYEGTNNLHGVDVATALTDVKTSLGADAILVLSNKGGNFGFHELATTNVPARKAFLALSGEAAKARQFTMVFEDATGIRSIDNGQLTIDNLAGAWYSLDGRKLSGKPTKSGVYVNSGRKVVIK